MTRAALTGAAMTRRSRAVSTEYCEAKDCTPRGRVYELSSLSTNSGSM